LIPLVPWNRDPILCMVRRLRKRPEGPARLVLGLWRSSSWRDSGRVSMERDTARKLVSISKIILGRQAFGVMRVAARLNVPQVRGSEATRSPVQIRAVPPIL
jgi:hypothetical protein